MASRTTSRSALLIATVVLALLTALPYQAQAQVWGTWSNPQPAPAGCYLAGASLLLGDLTGLMGHARIGLDEKFDIGAQIGIPDFDGNIGVGGDARYLIMEESDSFPLDLIGNGAIGYFDVGNSASFLDFAFGGLLAKKIDTSSGYVIVPHGGLLIDIGRTKVQSASKTDVGVQFRGGLEFFVNELFSVNGELDINTRSATNVYVSLGANYRFGAW